MSPLSLKVCVSAEELRKCNFSKLIFCNIFSFFPLISANFPVFELVGGGSVINGPTHVKFKKNVTVKNFHFFNE